MNEKFFVAFAIVCAFAVPEAHCGGNTFSGISSSPPSSFCPSKCQSNFELDPNTCECNCLKDKKCARGYYWADFYCGCLLICDYIKICPAGQKWDFIECACIDDPKYVSSPFTQCLIKCSIGYVANLEKCRCDLASNSA